MNIRDLNSNWEYLCYQSRDHFKSSSLLQHHAIQFIAIAGRYLAPQKNDGSNLGMHYYLKKKMLVGTWIDAKKFPIKVGIRLTDLYLMIMNPSFSEIASLNLQGHTKEEIFDWLNDKALELGAEMGSLKPELHYQIPEHPTENGAPFEIENKEEMLTLTQIRSNADMALLYFSRYFVNKTPNVTWPDSFKSSYTIPIELDDENKIRKYINIGLSPPDLFVDHYYFYVSHWDPDDIADYDKISRLEGDGYWVTRDRAVAVLPLQRFFMDKSKEEQVNRVVLFFQSALNNTFEILTHPELKVPEQLIEQ
jgi:hypothetical protein